MSTDAIQPIGPRSIDPAVDAVRPVTTVPATSATPHLPPIDRVGPAVGPGISMLGVAAMHEQLAHPVRSPAQVDARAVIHDAAMHGDRVADAIERSMPMLAGERAQQLAGAAASAGSGQASRIELAPPENSVSDPTDPLGPISAIDDEPGRRDPRSGEEQQADDDDMGT